MPSRGMRTFSTLGTVFPAVASAIFSFPSKKEVVLEDGDIAFGKRFLSTFGKFRGIPVFVLSSSEF